VVELGAAGGRYGNKRAAAFCFEFVVLQADVWQQWDWMFNRRVEKIIVRFFVVSSSIE